LKALPKIYGDRIDLAHSGKVETDPGERELTNLDLARRVAFMLHGASEIACPRGSTAMFDPRHDQPQHPSLPLRLAMKPQQGTLPMSVFTASFSAVAVSAAADVFEIVAPSDSRVAMRGVSLTQYTATPGTRRPNSCLS
jgi:hypothetical protein